MLLFQGKLCIKIVLSRCPKIGGNFREGKEEKGYDQETGELIVAVDSRYFRPTEVETLLGDPTKAKEKLGWTPKITLEQMVHEMMESDLNIAKRDELIKQHGYKAFDYNE